MKAFIFLFLSFIISQNINAQNSLKGVVTDKTNNEKLVGASVYVQEINKGTATNDKGEYSISDFSKGNYNIQISYLGYQTKIVKVNFASNDLTLDIQIEKVSIEVNEVVISGAYTTSQNESPQAIDVIKTTDLQRTGASTIMDIIDKVPGVSAITTGPLVSRPVIRGLSGNRILTVVDGVRFETQQWDDEHGIGVNELGMERIEIIKGAASLLYGPEAMGGVIHIIEEQPAPVGHLVGDIYGSIFSNNMGIIAGGDVKSATDKYNWGFNLLGKMLPDYYFNGYSFRAPNTRMNEIGGRANFGITRAWGSSSLTYQFNQAYYGILDGKDIITKPDGSIVNKDSTEKDMFPSEIEAPYHSVMDNKISSKTTLLAGLSKFQIVLGYQNNHRIEYEDTSGTKTGYKYVDMTLNTLTYDAKWYLPTWKHFSSIVGVQGMYQTNTNSPDAATRLVPDATINDFGVVFLTKFNLKNFNLTYGERYDIRNLSTVAFTKDSTVNMPAISRSYKNWSGSIGATYDIEEHLLLRANFLSGYRSPNLNELMSHGYKPENFRIEIGNPYFVKEQNNEIDLSAIFKTKFFSLEVATYINNITNYIYIEEKYISSSQVKPPYQYRQANAQIKGGEVGIDIHPSIISWAHLEIKASTLTGVLTDYISYLGEPPTDNRYLPMMPADKVNCTLFFNFKEYHNFKNIFARFGVVTTFAQNKVAAGELTTPGYTLVNLAFGATRNIWKLDNIDFALTVNNLLDKTYLDNMSRLRPFGISNQGINVGFSLKIPFDVVRQH